ncbi:MAG TPA: hypothetical protein PKK48_02755 [Phycisphaerae bacterium]|nr:hypothetical protein [Phycisphaerae bacterium]HPS53736.1 hypothetical protein [Phycisphaerae bacterium]
MRYWIFLSIALVLNALANILMKVGAVSEKPVASSSSFLAKTAGFLNVATVAGIILFAANVLVYRKALSGLPISVAYPVMVSVGLLIVVLLARFIPMLDERVSWLQIAGMIFIIAGVWMVSQTR